MSTLRTKRDRAEEIYDMLRTSTYAKQTINKGGKVYEVTSVIRSIAIRDLSCNCVSIADGPNDCITLIEELL